MLKIKSMEFLTAAAASYLRVHRVINGSSTNAFPRRRRNQLSVIRHRQGVNANGYGEFIDHLSSVCGFDLQSRVTRKCSVSFGEGVGGRKDVGTIYESIGSIVLRA